MSSDPATIRDVLRAQSRLGSLASAAVFVACGAGQAVPPAAIKGSDALGDPSARCPTAHSTPLVVDWKADERADLELAMQRGVAVVAYTCDGIKLLPDCHVAGTYGYAGVTQQEENVQIDDADELHATLPKMGALMGAKISAELERGTSIDIATMLVGKQRTAVEHVAQSDLVGTCSEATHFIRGASLGAFAMKQGTRGKIQASADIFGHKEDATSDSKTSLTSKAGVLDACKTADRGDTEPPKQCGAPFRVELDAVEVARAAGEAGETEPRPAGDRSDKGYVCPAGLVLSGGKCARPGSVASYACRRGDLRGCTEQCERGSGASCVALGDMYGEGWGVPIDQARSAALAQRGCELGDHAGCVDAAVKMFKGHGLPKNPQQALTILRRECDAGSFFGCTEVAEYEAFYVPQPTAGALTLGLRACNGGSTEGCAAVGQMYHTGKGAPKDFARAKVYFERACQEGRGLGVGCDSLGGLYASGEGVARDDARAFGYFEKGCYMRLPMGACDSAANFSEQGRGTPRDFPRAARFLKHGCHEGHPPACRRLGVAIAHRTKPDPELARKFLKRGCDLGDAESCTALKALP
jgi:TPR repeat protein